MNTDPQWCTSWCAFCETETRQLVVNDVRDVDSRLPVYSGVQNPFAPREAAHTCADCGETFKVVRP